MGLETQLNWKERYFTTICYKMSRNTSLTGTFDVHETYSGDFRFGQFWNGKHRIQFVNSWRKGDS